MGFSRAIRRIRACRSAGIGGRPGVDFQRQKSRNPWQCQRRNVSGCTTAKAARQSNQRASQTKIKQAAAVVRRSLTWRSWYSAIYLHYATEKERYSRHTQGTLLKEG